MLDSPASSNFVKIPVIKVITITKLVIGHVRLHNSRLTQSIEMLMVRQQRETPLLTYSIFRIDFVEIGSNVDRHSFNVTDLVKKYIINKFYNYV